MFTFLINPFQFIYGMLYLFSEYFNFVCKTHNAWYWHPKHRLWQNKQTNRLWQRCTLILNICALGSHSISQNWVFREPFKPMISFACKINLLQMTLDIETKPYQIIIKIFLFQIVRVTKTRWWWWRTKLCQISSGEKEREGIHQPTV